MNPKSHEQLITAVTAQSQETSAMVGASPSVSGEVLFPLDKGFEKARTAVWNLDTCGMPFVIVKCASSKDVAAAIAFAKENKLKICVHTAGAHSGQAVVDDTVVVDLSPLRRVEVDPLSKTVTVAGGATIGDVDKACKPHGLVLPMGHVHHTGVAGMALNATSGVGYLCRTRGLTVSYLQAATLVMADGSVRTISSTQNSELLWAIRGAGANFGVAVEMIFSVAPISPKVFSGDLVKFGKGDGPGKLLFCLQSKQTREELITKWFDFFSNKTTPDECSSLLVITPQGGPIVSRICYSPSVEDSGLSEAAIQEKGKAAFAPLADYGYTLMNSVKMADYWDGLQKMGQFEPSYFYQKGITATEISSDQLPGIVEELCSYTEACPINNMGTGIIIMPLAGQLMHTPEGTTATAHSFKSLKWWIIIIAEYPKGPKKAHLKAKCIQWVKDVYNVLEPFGVRDEDRERDESCHVYGDVYGSKTNVQKLRALKTKYDPENVFSLNRNILPN